MEDQDIIQQENGKVDVFIRNIESGITNTDNSKNNQEAIRQFLMKKRLEYSEAATKASKIQSNSYQHAELTQRMNDILDSVRNLAGQKNTLLSTQQTFMNDYENGLVSNANSLSDDGNRYADAFTGKLPIEIDEGGNVLFNRSGKKEPLQSYTNYTLKDYSTAKNVLDIANKVYNSGKPMNDFTKAAITASVKEQIAKGGRNTLLSLWADGLVPGMNYKDVDKSLFSPEKTQELLDLTVDKLANGIVQAADQGYAAKQQEKLLRSTARQNPNTAPYRGLPTTDVEIAQAIINKDKYKIVNGVPKDVLEIGNRFYVYGVVKGKDGNMRKRGWIETASPIKMVPTEEGGSYGKVYDDVELLRRFETQGVKKAYDAIKSKK
jgi:hypothetical protein